MTGFAWIAGAGPGDPDLITAGARRRLGEADVVVYDRLVNPQLLEHVAPGAERIDAGKTPGGRGMRQDEISRLLVERVREGKTVVRLKGGDPFVFGRGGEEAEALAAAGLPFAVIPGVTSAIAAPAYAGIPVTHRGIAGSFAVVTGHEDTGDTAVRIDIGAIARAVDTLVVLMGVSGLPAVVAAIIGGGTAAETPAAVVERGTYPDQRVVTGTVGTIVAGVERAGIRPPATLVVGRTVALRDGLDWRARQPLAGKRVLVTRPREQACAAAAPFEALGAEVIVLPAVEVIPTPPGELRDAVARLANGAFDWVVLTSANGVRVLFDALAGDRLDARAFGRTRVAAIGPATAAALADRGIRADLVPEEFISESLGASLGPLASGQRVLLARAAGARPVLASTLVAAGAEVCELALYRVATPPPDPIALARVRAGDIDVVTLGSPSAAEGLHRLLGGNLAPLATAVVASIGPVTSAAAASLGYTVGVEAAEHTFAGVARAILDQLEHEHNK